MKKINLSKILALVMGAFALIALCFTLTSTFSVHAEEETYEVADEISISDLKGDKTGSKIILGAHKSYTFDQTAENYSTVFSFIYKCIDPDTVDCQIHFSTTWLGDGKGGMIWLRYDNHWLKYDGLPATYDKVEPFPGAGTYQVECGKLYCLTGENQGKYKVYLKIDNVEVLSMYTDMPKISGIFLTGKNGDMMIDSNWTGSAYTFTVDGETYDSGNTINDYLTKPETDPTKPGYEFLGWYDEMGFEWDFEKDPVRDGLVLRAGFKSLAEETPDEVYFSDDNFTPVLRFMVESDVHISGAIDRRDSYLTESIQVAYSYAAKSSYKKLDAALFAGDVSDNGETSTLQRFKDTACAALDLKETKFIVAMGNHDHRTGTLKEAVDNFASIMGQPVDQHLIINGYHFISISPDMNTGCNFSDTKVQWLDQQLASAVADDPTKPVFVMQHEHVQGTVYGSINWGVSELKSVMQKYPQIVDFSGHSHFPLADPRSVWQGTFTCFGTGTLNFYEMGINGYKTTAVIPNNKTGGWKSNYSAAANAAEYLIVEVDANNAIRVIAYDLVSDSEIARYYIRNVADEIKTKYSHIEREKSSVAPSFEENQQLNLSVMQNSITVSFDQATPGEGCIVESYRIEIYENKSGIEKLVKTEYALSDYFFNPMPETITVKVESLKSLTDYTVKVYAINEWNDECATPIQGEITTEQAEAEVLEEPDRISVLDIQYQGNTGILANIGSENQQYKYNGKSKTFSSVISYYLIVGELKSTDELRVNVGNSWKLHNCIWYQTGKFDNVYFNPYYSSAEQISTKAKIKDNSIYLFEYGIIFAEKGEHKNQWYTYLKIDGKTYFEYYCDATEVPQTDYVVTMHLTQAFRIADVSLARNIEYYVDGKEYQKDFNINGLYLKEPKAPTKEGYFFVGWYDQEVGGNRVDFRNPLNSDDETVKYYARFTDKTYQVKFYNYDGTLLEDQTVGEDCLIVIPEDPVKTGKYKYSFVKWINKETKEDFDFNERVNGNLKLEAVFQEYRYKIVYRVDGLEYVTKYYIESNSGAIIGGEPPVPEIDGVDGYWEYSGTRKNSDIYAIARYNGYETQAGEVIALNKFNGKTVDIMDDTTRFYMNFADTNEQAKWIDSYPVSGGHERQDISFSWTDPDKNKAYYVYFADNADFTNAYIIKTESRNVDYVGIFTPGKTYYWKVFGISTSTWSDVDTFVVLNSGVRWISADTVYNMRDMGGWTTTDGKVLNYGLIYRGGQLSKDNPGEASFMSDYSYKVFDYLGIKTEIELRGDYPHELNQWNDLAQLIFVNGTGYAGFITANEKHKLYYQAVFTALADINNYPFYYHCSWGADRTGSLGFLIGGVLGVPLEQLAEDYELTSFSYSGSRTRIGYDGGQFNSMVKAFMDNYARGGSLQEAVYNYLTEYIGVKPAEIDALKANMLSTASAPLTTHTVTYKINGEVYQISNVFEGSTISVAPPVYFEKFLDYWTLDGVKYDETTPVTTDLVLEAHFEYAKFDEYDTITVRDLGYGEQLTPTAETFKYEGTATTHGRLFTFDYYISADDGSFSDGVHIEFGESTWLWKAHVWIQSAERIYIFTAGADATGNSNPTGSYTANFTIGFTYHVTCGVICPINGEYAGKKMLLLKINDEIICYVETSADLMSNYNISFAGTEGIMKSVANKMTVNYLDAQGNVLETKEITRGEKTTEINHPEAPENKVFLGWFDAYGNAWNFETTKVLNNVNLYAKYGDKTIDAAIVDASDMLIQYGYKVKLGIQVSEIETPIVSDDTLEFDGWFNGETRLNSTDVITEDMELICKFKVKSVEPVKKGCKSAIASTFGLFAMLALTGVIFIKKKRNED